MAWRCVWAAAVVCAWSAVALGQVAGRPMQSGLQAALRTFQTPYYVLYTDLTEADAREADLRMTRMFEEYQRRTSGFAGRVNSKFPFYLYRSPDEYYAAGGPPKSDGVFMRRSDGQSKLMAIAGEHANAETWHVVQHEGFHQFVAATIQYELPIWVNEGLAEYFGEAIWTGDGFVSGLIPQERLLQIKEGIRSGQFKPFRVMMAMSHQEWGDDLDYSNYNEAWAMVHFLAHADNGKYQGPFVQFLTRVSRGQEAQAAWDNVFGRDTDAFQAKFAEWWMNLPDHPTRQGFMQVLVQTETSYLARAWLQHITFTDPETFFKTYEPAGLTLNRDLWLPPNMFKQMSAAALRGGDWTIETPKNQLPHLVLKDSDGAKYTGTFTLGSGKVTRVGVEIAKAGTQPSQSRPAH